VWAAFALAVIASGDRVYGLVLDCSASGGLGCGVHGVIPVVAAEGEEPAQEVFETGWEFDVRISHVACEFSAWALAGGESLGSNSTNGTLESGRKRQ
jgi:hypothetical protein